MLKHTETTITINFELPFSAEKIFDFIILPTSMPLYKGFLLFPAIKHVDSSDKVRRVGTRDQIFNTDGSTHISVTMNIIRPSHYLLEIGDIKIIGWKKILTGMIIGFYEDWTLTEVSPDKTAIERKLIIKSNSAWWVRLLIMPMITPQLKASLMLHHSRIKKALS
jgi:hypothetical protein